MKNTLLLLFFLMIGASLADQATGQTIYWTVGNDPSKPACDFGQLNHALVEATKYRKGNNFGVHPVKITIPEGEHLFYSINLKGVDLSHVLVKGEGRSKTIIHCVPSDTTKGNWLDASWCKFGDWYSMEFRPADTVNTPTNPDDTIIDSTQRFQFFHLYGTDWKHLQDISFNGNTNGCRYGMALALEESSITLDEISINNIGMAIQAYANSHVWGGYQGVKATQVMNFLKNHESIVRLRKIAASAYTDNNNDITSPKSVFVDTYRGETSLWDISPEDSISRFDRLFNLNLATIKCQVSAKHFKKYNTILSDFGSNNIFFSNLPLTTEELLSDNIFGYYQLNARDIPTLAPKKGVISYTGVDSSVQVVNDTFPLPNVVEVKVRKKSDIMSLNVLRGTVGQINGANACWISETDNTIRVYGPMNEPGVEYELIWTR